MSRENFQRQAMRVSHISIVGNVILSAFKFFAGIFASSSAMISDAIHSASDVLSTVVVIIGVKMASKDEDDTHQYGHERMECVAAIILSMMLAVTGAGIGLAGIKKIINGSGNTVIPGTLALIAAIISIIGKEVMYQWTKRVAKKISSGALMADAWHHRSDALSSVGSFIGILGARLGFPVLDSVASVIICVFIIKAAFDIFSDAIGKMTDKACKAETVEQIKEITLSTQGVLGIDRLKTRLFGNKIYVELEIQADGNKTLNETHEIAHNVHDAIEENIKNTKHCTVHVNPAPEGLCSNTFESLSEEA